MRCTICKAPSFKGKVTFYLEGKALGTFDGMICRNNHKYFSDEAVHQIEAAAKLYYIWKRAQHVKPDETK